MAIRGPFWLILKNRGKKPYFGMFVKEVYDGPKKEVKEENKRKRKPKE